MKPSIVPEPNGRGNDPFSWTAIEIDTVSCNLALSKT
jgi:hypothetical protein